MRIILAYYDTDLITDVKKFIVSAFFGPIEVFFPFKMMSSKTVILKHFAHVSYLVDSTTDIYSFDV